MQTVESLPGWAAERSDWTSERVCSSQEEGQCGELILNSWLYVLQTLSLKLMVPPRLRIHLRLSLTHRTPVLERGGIFYALCSLLVQCLLWSGVKDFFPWLLVLQMVQGRRGVGRKLETHEENWRVLGNPIKISTRTTVWENWWAYFLTTPWMIIRINIYENFAGEEKSLDNLITMVAELSDGLQNPRPWQIHPA